MRGQARIEGNARKSRKRRELASDKENSLEKIRLTFSFRNGAAPAALQRVVGEHVDLPSLPDDVRVTRHLALDRGRHLRAQVGVDASALSADE